jgi:AcrR family transcriptional regulator
MRQLSDTVPVVNDEHRIATLAYREAMGQSPTARRTPADAFNAARRHIRAGDKLDMVALAEELGVARATLYRWTGDRDRLLADVVVAELQDLIGAAAAHATGHGVERLQLATAWFLDTLAQLPALRAFLLNEGDGGLRLLTAPTGPVRPQIVKTVAAIIDHEAAEGDYRPPAAPQLLADGIVALAERYLHNGGDPTLNPDPTTARTIAALLLREPCE